MTHAAKGMGLGAVIASVIGGVTLYTNCHVGKETE
jgi:hypothetical protein